MAKRIKKTQIEAPSRDQLPPLMERVALASARKKRIEADLEAQIAKLRAKRQAEIDEISAEIQECTDKLEAWAIAHPDQWEKKRSLDLTHGMIGFRLGGWKVKYDRGISRKAVEILKGLGLSDYLRTKEEVNKDALIAEKSNEELMQQLKPVGIHVVQEESFYIQPKEEEYA